MALKKTLAEFMGVSEEWLAGYEAAKAEEQSCDGCIHQNDSRYSAYCYDCTHVNYNDNYEPKVVE